MDSLTTQSRFAFLARVFAIVFAVSISVSSIVIGPVQATSAAGLANSSNTIGSPSRFGVVAANR